MRNIKMNPAWLCNLGSFKNHNHYQFSSMSSSKNQFLFQFIISFILTFDDFSLEKNNDKENLMMTTYNSINWHFRHNMSKNMGNLIFPIKFFFERPFKVRPKKLTRQSFSFRSLHRGIVEIDRVHNFYLFILTSNSFNNGSGPIIQWFEMQKL